VEGAFHAIFPCSSGRIEHKVDRMATLTRHLIWVGLILLWSSAAHAGELTAALFRLQKATLTLVNQTQSRLESLDRDLVKTLVADLETLQSLASNGVEPGAEEAYATSVDFDAWLIERANGTLSVKAATILIQDVVADLALKIGVGRNGYGASAVLKALVLVTATAVDKGNRPVLGILLGLKPLLYENAEPMFFFSSPVPSQGKFPPGRYIIVDTNSKQINQRVDIGLDGADEQQVHVLVNQP
jgi:hypothetical protein